MKQRIAVFLSSKSNLPDSYVQTTVDVGRWIGATGRTLVYGGARKGLMEVLAETVKQNGGRVVGVVPQVLVERALVSELPDMTILTADLHERKSVMMRECDAVIALPGGIGTLDEILTVLATRTIGIDRRLPVVLYNVDGCWDSFIAALNALHGQGLIDESPEELLSVVESIDELAVR